MHLRCYQGNTNLCYGLPKVAGTRNKQYNVARTTTARSYKVTMSLDLGVLIARLRERCCCCYCQVMSVQVVISGTLLGMPLPTFIWRMKFPFKLSNKQIDIYIKFIEKITTAKSCKWKFCLKNSYVLYCYLT